MVLLDSTSLDTMHKGTRLSCISEFTNFFQNQSKDVKSCSKSPTAMIFKVLYRFLNSYIVLLQYEVNSDSKHGSFNVQHFLHYLKKLNLLFNEE